MDKSRQIQEASRKVPHYFLAYAGIWCAVIAWGASFVAARVLLHGEGTDAVSLSPTVLAALRFSIASLLPGLRPLALLYTFTLSLLLL